MRKLWKAAIPLLLGAGLMLGSLTTSAAPADQFSDIQGHWAQATLEQAYADGIMNGTSDVTMSPDDSITKAQAVTLLCRILKVSGEGSTSALAVPVDAWYAKDAAHGAYLGLLNNRDAGTLDLPITRGEAFVLFTEAFQNAKALPGREALDGFTDGPYLTGDVAFATENLIDSGVVNGVDDNLMADKHLTRAEFVTMLYRVADAFLPASEYTGRDGSGTVLSGNAKLDGISAGSLWFDQTSSAVYLTDTDTDLAVLRSDRLSGLTLSGNGHIGTLVLAASQGDINLKVPESYSVSTLTVGDGGGALSLSGRIPSVEVIGDGRTVTINADPSGLAVSGSGNTITLNNTSSPVRQIVITGTDNTIILNGDVDKLRIEGRDNTISGSGTVSSADLLTRYCDLDVSTGETNEWTSYDLSNVTVDVQAPKTLPAGEHLKATACLTFPEADRGKLCSGVWYLNGQKVQEAPVILGRGNPTCDVSVNYTHNLQQEAVLRYELTHINNDGETFLAQGSASLYLETFQDLGLADASIELVAPATLPAGQTLTVSAPIVSPEAGKVCTAHWSIDGREISEDEIVLGTGAPHFYYDLEYYYGMPETIQVSCKVTYTTADGRDQEISDSAVVHVENYPDTGIARSSASLNVPETLPAGETLKATANLTYPQAGKACTGVWYVDGKQVSIQTIVLGTDTPSLSYKYEYSEKMNTTSEILFALSYMTEDGRYQEITTTKTVTLQNYGYEYYHGPTDQEILKMVTNKYAGNYTLAWAQNHDYSQNVKTRWVNLQGYSSKSKYLIWVNLTYQRVNIFEGSQGRWTLIRSCLCGSGKPSTPTISGVFAVTYKQNAWNYGSYYCGPVVRFYGGYAFHSRLEYWPMGSGRYYDARIGFPISHGCLRMYDNDIWWIYNNIPSGTTVVVH